MCPSRSPWYITAPPQQSPNATGKGGHENEKTGRVEPASSSVLFSACASEYTSAQTIFLDSQRARQAQTQSYGWRCSKTICWRACRYNLKKFKVSAELTRFRIISEFRKKTCKYLAVRAVHQTKDTHKVLFSEKGRERRKANRTRCRLPCLWKRDV